MLPIVESLLNEFREEVPATRRILERVPADKLSWKPHAKSRTLGELAMHVASIPGNAERVTKSDEFTPGSVPPAVANSAADIQQAFEKNVRSAEAALSGMSDDKAMGDWRIVFKGKEVLRKPRVAALRTTMLNHLYHHRGQLSVYLRLLEVPVPPIYGPTADENPFD